jgi:hypothetical protein
LTSSGSSIIGTGKCTVTCNNGSLVKSNCGCRPYTGGGNPL